MGGHLAMKTLFQTFVVIFVFQGAAIHAVDRPNVLWFVIDDMSANFSCFGEKTILTPAVDQLAEDGLLLTRAYVTSPVCSTFRSAMIAGMYQNSIGSHHHRSGRGEHRIRLPKGVRPIPDLFKKAGCFTCIGSGLVGPRKENKPVNIKTTSRSFSAGQAQSLRIMDILDGISTEK
jgi:arylsulfatase A-like enzyme